MDTAPTATPPPNTIPWPPLLTAGAAVVAVVVDLVRPLDPGVPPTLGWALVAVGFGLDLWAMTTMARARANILPHRAATALVTHGPFRLSRNPIYVANVLLLVGLGLAVGNAWFLPAAAVAALLTRQLAIVREEAHLATLFGDAWTAYAARTRRWL